MSNFKAIASALCALTVLIAAAPVQPVLESDYPVMTANGSVSGTLAMPPGNAKVPVVLIVAGSGPVDRDGNAPPTLRSDTYKALAMSLAHRGIASVRYDKIGVGKSAALLKDPADARFGMYVDTAVAYLKALRADTRFSKIVIAGHSEGALIATLAAQRANVDAVVLLEGAGRPLGTVVREQIDKNPMNPPEIVNYSHAALDSLMQGHPYAPTPPAPLVSLFSPKIAPFLMSVITIDPAAELAKLRVPVTIVQGTYDAQITMTDANRLAAALPSARLVTLDELSHTLKDAASANLMEQLSTVYADPTLPIDLRVVDAVEAATH